jgi:hypothetical protein
MAYYIILDSAVDRSSLYNLLSTGRVVQHERLTQAVSRYTVYRRPSSAMAALQLLLRTKAISCKSRLALTLEEQR